MIYYRVKEDGTILDKANFKYADDCLETDKNIVRGFDGVLVFEEDIETVEYITRKAQFDKELKTLERKEEIKARMSELSQDFVQVTVGAKIDNINERILEFQNLHNELRTLEGKEVREYGSN